MTAQPRQVAVDEAAIKTNGEWSWLYAAIDVGRKLLLDAHLFKHRGMNPAATFLHRLTEKHNCEQTMFLVDPYGYRAALSRLEVSGQVDHIERNLIEKWFYTVKMRVDCFHNSRVGSRLDVCHCIALFARYYNFHRPQ